MYNFVLQWIEKSNVYKFYAISTLRTVPAGTVREEQIDLSTAFAPSTASGQEKRRAVWKANHILKKRNDSFLSLPRLAPGIRKPIEERGQDEGCQSEDHNCNYLVGQ
jgi:hypothetical protein